jgi:hypothetical protein
MKCVRYNFHATSKEKALLEEWDYVTSHLFFIGAMRHHTLKQNTWSPYGSKHLKNLQSLSFFVNTLLMYYGHSQIF